MASIVRQAISPWARSLSAVRSRWYASVSAASADQSGHQAVVDSWQVNCQGATPGLVGPRTLDWYTGKAPVHGVCPGVSPEGVITALAQPNLETVTRQEMRDYFDNCWTLTEVLFASLQGEEPFYRPPYHNLRHPKIFYYAHPASVYVNKFRVAGLFDAPINEYYEHIFETGVDEMQWDDLSKNDMLWPTVGEVKEYRQQVYNAIVDVIENHPDFDNITKLESSPFWALVMGTEHEKIHLETSSVLMRELPLELVSRPDAFPPVHESAKSAPPSSLSPIPGEHYPLNEMLPVAGGAVNIGKPRDFPSYGWDNEYGDKQMQIRSFQASKFLISNGEFLDFVKNGGYLNENLWEPEGWKWRCFRNVKWPTFWVPVGPSGLHQYRLRSLFEVVDMPWNWPVQVNYHEAKAFANWKSDLDGIKRDSGYRLTTEAEHHRIRDKRMTDSSLNAERDHSMVADGPAMLRDFGYNMNLATGSETPVDANKPASTGFHDVFGNSWEWQEDHMSALPGFKVHPYYNDFTLPCFDGQHHLILGGSFISCGDEASMFARFHFRPHFFQHSGFRLVLPNQEDPTLVTSCMDNQGPYVGTNPFRCTKNDEVSRKYKAEEVQRQYVHLHYGTDANVPQETQKYPERVAGLLERARIATGAPTDRALDLGCSVGGISFQLAKTYKNVLGFDVSSSFIEQAQEMLELGEVPYYVSDEGELKHHLSAPMPSGVTGSVEFKQVDAMCLPPDLGEFDAVLAANIIDRVPSPETLLGRFGGPRGIVRAGGLLLVSSPFTWVERYTPQDLWLGGKETPNGPVRSKDVLYKYLNKHFELVEEEDIPFTLREHSRKFEYVVSAASVWRHRN